MVSGKLLNRFSLRARGCAFRWRGVIVVEHSLCAQPALELQQPRFVLLVVWVRLWIDFMDGSGFLADWGTSRHASERQHLEKYESRDPVPRRRAVVCSFTTRPSVCLFGVVHRSPKKQEVGHISE